jgi:hypothetical protein
MADKLCPRFAESHWVVYKDGKHFCEAPACTRGVPHNLVPGVHAALDYYGEAIETLRRHTGREDAPTVDSLQALPYSAWTQSLAPVIEATADLSMRLCVRDPTYMSIASGKAYLPDATSEQEAIVREPLLRRPSQTSISDNPFATSYEHIDTFFNAANHLSLIARALDRKLGTSPHDPVEELWTAIDDLIMGASDPGVDAGPWMAQAADAVLLICIMYPCTWKISERCIPLWAARAAPEVVKALEAVEAGESAECMRLGRLFDAAVVKQAQSWWAAFRRRRSGESSVCAWDSGLAPLLKLLHAHGGSHYVTDETRALVREALDRAVQAAFLVHSADGTAPPPDACPASAAKSPEGVRRPMIDPIFVGNEERGVDARGCLVGLKPFQYRQLCCLAMGAHCKDVECQVARNEGAPPTPLPRAHGADARGRASAQAASASASARRRTSSTRTATRAARSPSPRCKRKVLLCTRAQPSRLAAPPQTVAAFDRARCWQPTRAASAAAPTS